MLLTMWRQFSKNSFEYRRYQFTCKAVLIHILYNSFPVYTFKLFKHYEYDKLKL